MSHTDCPRRWDRARALGVVMAWPHLDAAGRCRLLEGMKRGLCDCYELCDYGQDIIVAAARAAGEIP